MKFKSKNLPKKIFIKRVSKKYIQKFTKKNLYIGVPKK
jgi:hypothetical protein